MVRFLYVQGGKGGLPPPVHTSFIRTCGFTISVSKPMCEPMPAVSPASLLGERVVMVPSVAPWQFSLKLIPRPAVYKAFRMCRQVWRDNVREERISNGERGGRVAESCSDGGAAVV